MKGIVAVSLMIIGVAILSFLLTTGLIAVACWAFNFTFSWKLSLGIWVVMILISACVKAIIEKED